MSINHARLNKSLHASKLIITHGQNWRERYTERNESCQADTEDGLVSLDSDLIQTELQLNQLTKKQHLFNYHLIALKICF